MRQAYRRSIWKQDEKYRIGVEQISTEMINKIGIIQSIEAAKKRTPPMPISHILKMAQTIERLPDSQDITVAGFEEALRRMDSWGAGLKTVVCILCVLTKGRYPPLDWKIAKAARLKGIIDDREERALNGVNRQRVAEIYVRKLIPRWLDELQTANNPEALDNAWATSAESR